VIDVVIVGAGPAGCAAAIRCVQRGLSTVIVDPAAGAGDRPGETLHPGVEVIFETLGIADRLAAAGIIRHSGQWVGSEFQHFGSDADGPWLGYQIPASVLDPILVERAIECGAKLHRELAQKPLVRDGCVIGIATASIEIHARIVIDASGRRQWLATSLGLERDIRSSPLLAFYGYRSNATAEEPRFRALDNGWEWTAPIANNRTAWVRLAHADDAAAVLANAPDLDAAPRAADVTWRIARPAAGPGYLLAGDSAFVLDPASSHGVLKALLTGTNAAVCAADILQGPAPAAEICHAYDTWIAEMFEHDVRGLTEAYERMGIALNSGNTGRPPSPLARP
jgi:flavin-dependent dehydrogenase